MPDPIPELLSPAGNWNCARAAVAAGADAIYFGLTRFNARLRADNFTEDDLPRLIDYLHRHGKRGFVTMNTLVFTAELEAAEQQLLLLARAGVDAIIVQDLGLARLASWVAPAIELHASTQMTISSPEGLAFVESLVPLKRTVLARELSVRELARFRTGQPPPRTPLEVFVHGALCVAYSGQCLTSESLGQRSANRGECAQACRMPYEILVDGVPRELGEVRYLLSPQDLAAVDLLPELVRAGIQSFKIEGRLKSPEYVAAVTRVYRKALDAAIAACRAARGETAATAPVPSPPVTTRDRYALEMTFSRGLSTGWLGGTDHPGLTHGRFGKKRGPLLGCITACGAGWVELGQRSATPLAAGDGVVFDAGEDRNEEQGARVWKIEGGRLLFHRAHSGLDFARIRPGQWLWKTSDPKLEGEIRRFWQNAKPPEKRHPLHLCAAGAPGQPLVLTVDAPAGGGVEVRSAVALQVAAKHPLTRETLFAQLGRLGGTRHELVSLKVQLDGPCHLPLSELNQLRRGLVAALDQAPATDPVPPAPRARLADLLPPAAPRPAPAEPALSVLCRSLEQLAAALECRVPVVYCDFEDPRRYREALAAVHGDADPPALFLATPRILKPGEGGYLKLIDHAGAEGVLIRNLGALQHYRERPAVRRVLDFSLNVANPLSARLLMEAARADWLTVSYDLNIAQALDLLRGAPPQWFELTLHQHMPLFHMEHCVFCAFLTKGKDFRDCGRPCEAHVVQLRDRVGQLHRLSADVGCRNTLFHGRAQTGARFLPALLAAGLRRFRIELLDETTAEARRLITVYQSLLRGEIPPDTLLRQVKAFEKLGVTEGTLA